VDSRAVVDAVVMRKIHSPCRESKPRSPIVQPLAQRHVSQINIGLPCKCHRNMKNMTRGEEQEGYIFPHIWLK
jgi:hypothetical protein